MKLNYKEYRERVNGCFVGKSVGGTLGMRFEGGLSVNNVTYYDPVPDEMIPNDDLDLQVTALEIIMRDGLPVSRAKLGDLWNLYNRESLPDEYGVAEGNYRKMIYAPLSGVYNNAFHSGMGAAIRSELWACLAPGDPELAVRLATEDGCVDHAGDGISAVRFLAAIESAAFVENDLQTLVEIGMKYLPVGERMHVAFTDTIAWWDETKDYLEVRKLILEKYGCENWTDVTINLSFVLLSILSCEDNFDKAICHAVNMGYDADCTAATVGALFGIMRPNSIDEKWTRPIGNALVLSYNMANMTESATIDDFTDEIAYCCEKVQEYYHSKTQLCDIPSDRKSYVMGDIRMSEPDETPYKQTEALITDQPIIVRVIYPEQVAYVPDTDNRFTIRLINPTDKVLEGCFSIGTSQNVICIPRNFDYKLERGQEALFDFTVEKRLLKGRINVNKVNLAFTTNGLKWSCAFGFPDSKIYYVENLESGETFTRNISAAAFSVPAGKYRYTLNFKLPAPKTVRLLHNGKSHMSVYLNGEKLIERNGTERYVPAIHRGCYTDILPESGYNAITLEFDNDKETEAFLDFGNIAGCGTWVSDVEYK